MGFDMLIVCKDTNNALRLYTLFITVHGIYTTARERNRRECRFCGNTVNFITEAQLDIYQQGRHNAKVLSGADVQAHLYKLMRQVRFV